jgi:hypothetical protein
VALQSDETIGDTVFFAVLPSLSCPTPIHTCAAHAHIGGINITCRSSKQPVSELQSARGLRFEREILKIRVMSSAPRGAQRHLKTAVSTDIDVIPFDAETRQRRQAAAPAHCFHPEFVRR